MKYYMYTCDFFPHKKSAFLEKVKNKVTGLTLQKHTSSINLKLTQEMN